MVSSVQEMSTEELILRNGGNPYRTDDDPRKKSIEELVGIIGDKTETDSIDTFTGAPMQVRAEVAAAPSYDDKLATLKKYYPDAVPVETYRNGADKFGEGNYVFLNPETDRLTLFDEDQRLFGMPFPTMRDILADPGPETAEMIGGTGGGLALGAAGAAAGSPTILGSVPTATAGFMLGEAIGSASARELYLLALNKMGEMEDTRTPSDQFADFGFTASSNLFGGIILNRIFRGLGYMFETPIRWAGGKLSRAAEDTLKIFQDVGVTEPTYGQVTGNPLAQFIESTLARLPTSTKTMHDNARQTLAQIEDYHNKITGKVGTARTKEEAGGKFVDAAEARVDKYVRERNAKYDAVKAMIDPNFSGKVPESRRLLQEFIESSGLETLESEYKKPMLQLQKLMNDEEAGRLTFANLSKIKTSFGDAIQHINSKLEAPTNEEKHFIQMYSAIKLDLDNLVEQAARNKAVMTGGDLGDGAPDAIAEQMLKKYQEASNFVAKNEGKRGGVPFLKRIMAKAGGELGDDVKAMKFVFENINDNSQRVARIKEMLDPEEFDELSGYILGNLGTPSAANREAVGLAETLGMSGKEYVSAQGFSPQSFLNNWGKLSKESKEVLFGGTRHKDLVPEVDNLINVIERTQEAAKAYANPSGTAQALLGSSWLTGTAYAMYGMGDAGFTFGLAGSAMPYGASKLMTNPDFVKWLTGAVEKQAFDPSTYGQHVRRLFQVYQANPEIREEVMGVLERHQGESVEPLPDHKSSSAREAIVPDNNEANFREVSTREVSDKLLPTSEELMGQMDQVIVPQVEGPLFEETITETPDVNLAMSPTVLPRDDDRELALRLRGNAGGIGALV